MKRVREAGEISEGCVSHKRRKAGKADAYCASPTPEREKSGKIQPLIYSRQSNETERNERENAGKTEQ